MDVNGLTPRQSAEWSRRRTGSSKTGQSGHTGDVVRLANFDRARMLRLVAERSLERLRELALLTGREVPDRLGDLDVSPEATSDRIAGFAINLFPLYMKQHPEMDEATALNEYQKLVTNAVNSGYQDALAVLSTLGVDDRGVLDTAKETIDLTFEKLNNFFDARRAGLGAAVNA